MNLAIYTQQAVMNGRIIITKQLCGHYCVAGHRLLLLTVLQTAVCKCT
jgi:hypothetical protein